jgi:hypothetical protein
MAFLRKMNLSLDFLWDFLQPVFEEEVKKELARKDEAQAKEELMALYQALVQMETKTELFVGCLEALVRADQATLAQEGRPRITAATTAARDLLASLPTLAQAMESLLPALSIHRHELIQEINSYRQSRALVISRLEEEVEKIERGGYESRILSDLYMKSLDNLGKIKSASEGMRQFIAEQFSFQELL